MPLGIRAIDLEGLQPMLARSFRGLAAAFLVTIAVTACSGGSDSADPTGSTARPTASAATSGSAATKKAAPPAVTVKPSVAVSQAPAVKLGQKTRLLPKVLVRADQVRRLEVKTKVPGEVNGPGVSVRITVSNRSGKPFDLSGLVVNASYGNNTPGDSSVSKPADPLKGSLADGTIATGRYVFLVPRNEVSSLKIEVTSNESPAIIHFNS